MNSFTIRDLENLSGIKAHTIRIWEQRYQFLKPRRTETNIRYYSSHELRTVLNIALLNKYGYRISQIDKLPAEEILEKVQSLSDPAAVQERIVNELVHEMAGLHMDRFETILQTHIQAKGVERTVMQIIFPFLEKIGILWQAGHINAAQEHLVTNLVRQKLIVAIESTHSTVAIDKTFLLYLPEGEYHELGLLFIYYLLKSRGAKTIYLGANVPLADVNYVVQTKNPDACFIHLNATSSSFRLEKFINNVQRNQPQIPTIISGQLTQHFRKKLPPGIEFKRSLSEVLSWVSML